MARTVTVQAGKQNVQIFAGSLLQNTGERFLKPLLQTPDVHGCATVLLQESSVPALVEAFQILDHERTPDRVSVPEYLKLMLTLSSCNAWSALQALTASLVPEIAATGYYLTSTEKIPFPVLKSTLEIMRLFLPGIKPPQNKKIGIADKALPIDL